MSWRDFIEEHPAERVLPWFGGNKVATTARTFTIEGKRPPFTGWWTFEVIHRTARWNDTWWNETHEQPIPNFDEVIEVGHVYLVGDRWLNDHRAKIDDASIMRGRRVWFVDKALERFAYARIGALHSSSPHLVYMGPSNKGDFWEAEMAARRAYEDRKPDLVGVPNVHPALDLAFRVETWRRAERERLEAEAERKRAEELARLEREAQRAEIERRLGSGAMRREVAKLDINAAARAALKLANAELLDMRPSRVVRDGHIVSFRVDDERYECICDGALQVVNAGMCLVDHRTGIVGDTWFTLESLPSVIREAVRDDVLVRFTVA